MICNLGQVAQLANRSREAKRWFSLALQSSPANADVLHCLGNICLTSGEYKEAANYYVRTLEQDGRNPDALNNLGGALLKLDDASQARTCFEQALAIAPKHERALENLGELMARDGQLANALKCFDQALGENPQIETAHLKRGRVLRRLKRQPDAKLAFERTLKGKPNNSEAIAELAVLAHDDGRHALSQQLFNKATRLSPQNALFAYLKSTSLPVIYPDNEAIDRSRNDVKEGLDAMKARGLQLDPRRHSPNTFFYLAYHGCNDRALQSDIASVWNPTDTELPPRPEHERIRVGFLTRYLTGHTIGMLNGGLIANLDAERFETVTFAFEDKHPWFREHSAEFHVAPQRPDSLIDYVRSQKLDILIFPEIGMDPLTNAVARSRMAPTQCVTWGHPVTTGIPTIDYFLSSRLLETANAADHYSEDLVLLDTLPAFYFRPDSLQATATRNDLGLPENANLYACPQSLFKFHPDFDAALDAILELDGEGVVVLLEGANATWTELLKARFRKTMRNHARIKWLPRLSGEDFFALLSVADVVLDPFHFGGGRSNYLTLAAGTPLVTFPSKYMRGRVAAGMYEKLDYRECVTHSLDEYAGKAVALGGNEDYRRTVGDELRNRSEILFEDREAVNELERFLTNARQRQLSGQDISGEHRPLHSA